LLQIIRVIQFRTVKYYLRIFIYTKNSQIISLFVGIYLYIFIYKYIKMSERLPSIILPANVVSELEISGPLTVDSITTTGDISSSSVVTSVIDSAANALSLGVSTSTSVNIGHNAINTSIAGFLRANDMDTNTATTLYLGKAIATSVEIASASVITNIQGPLSMSNHIISDMLDPSSDQDAATKLYVDNIIDDSTTTSTTTTYSASKINSVITDASDDADITALETKTANISVTGTITDFADDVDLNSNKLLNVADGTLDTDGINLLQLTGSHTAPDGKITALETKTANITATGTATDFAGDVDLNSNKLLNVADGTLDTDGINLLQLTGSHTAPDGKITALETKTANISVTGTITDFSGDVDLNSNKLLNVADGTLDTDGINLLQLTGSHTAPDGKITALETKTDNITATGTITDFADDVDLKSNKLLNVADGTLDTDGINLLQLTSSHTAPDGKITALETKTANITATGTITDFAGDVDLNSNKLLNVADGTLDTDGINLLQLTSSHTAPDGKITALETKTDNITATGTATDFAGDVDLKSNKLLNVADGTLDTDGINLLQLTSSHTAPDGKITALETKTANISVTGTITDFADDVDLNSNKLLNVADGTLDTDGINLLQLTGSHTAPDGKITALETKTDNITATGTATDFAGDVDLNSNKLLNVADGTLDTDGINLLQLTSSHTAPDGKITALETKTQNMLTVGTTSSFTGIVNVESKTVITELGGANLDTTLTTTQTVFSSDQELISKKHLDTSLSRFVSGANEFPSFALTADNDPPYIASSSTDSGAFGTPQAWTAFNKSVVSSEEWTGLMLTSVPTTIVDVGSVGIGWLQIDLGTAVASTNFRIAKSGTADLNEPTEIYIVGSNDNSTWYNLFYASGMTYATGVSGAQEYIGTITTPVLYRYYRMVILTAQGSAISVSVREWWIYEDHLILSNIKEAYIDALFVDKYFTPPKLTSAQRDALTPSEGNVIYNTTDKSLNLFSDSAWRYVNNFDRIYILESLPPVDMTSATLPSPYVVTQSSSTGWYAYRTANHWSVANVYAGVDNAYSGANSLVISGVERFGEWLAIDLGGVECGESVDIKVYASPQPMHFYIAGSLDGVTWNELGRFTDPIWVTEVFQNFVFDNIVKYRHYAILIDKGTHSVLRVTQIRWKCEKEGYTPVHQFYPKQYTTATLPIATSAGSSVYDTTDNMMKWYNGTEWVIPTVGIGTDVKTVITPSLSFDPTKVRDVSDNGVVSITVYSNDTITMTGAGVNVMGTLETFDSTSTIAFETAVTIGGSDFSIGFLPNDTTWASESSYRYPGGYDYSDSGDVYLHSTQLATGLTEFVTGDIFKIIIAEGTASFCINNVVVYSLLVPESVTYMFFVRDNSSTTGIFRILSTNATEINSALIMTSTTDAFTPPKLTSSQRDALTPSEGNVIYNTTFKSLNLFSDSAWRHVENFDRVGILESLPPADMTSATLPSPYVVTQSSGNGWYAYTTNSNWQPAGDYNGVDNAYDGANSLVISGVERFGEWIAIDLGGVECGESVDIKVSSVQPVYFYIAGSLDGVTWNELGRVTDPTWEIGVFQNFVFDNIVKYRHYAILIDKATTHYLRVTQIRWKCDKEGYTPVHQFFPKQYTTATLPIPTSAGSSVYDTTVNKMKFYDGTEWVSTNTTKPISYYDLQKNGTAEQTSITGIIGTTKYMSGVLATNGKIYCVPLGQSTVLIIDPITDTAERTSITGLSGTVKYIGSVLAPNGKIYGVPFSESTVLIIDPSNDTAEQTSITGITGSNNWKGGVLAENGKIYCVPYDATTVLIIDPTTDTAEETSITGITGSGKWEGGVLAENGKIYCIPNNATTVLIIDPTTDTAEETSITGITGSNKYIGGVLAPNGKIYCVPYNATTVLIIDPITNTAEQTSITGLTGSEKWQGGVLAPNGKIYCAPLDSTTVLIIDPTTDTAEQTSITGLTGSGKYIGSVLAPNGKIYCVPFSATTVLIITPIGEQTVSLNRCLSAYYNKF
jgi:hypothetical protein